MSQDAPAPVERPKPPFRRVVVFVGRDEILVWGVCPPPRPAAASSFARRAGSAAARTAAPSATTSTSRSPALVAARRDRPRVLGLGDSCSASPTPTRIATSAAGRSPAGASPTSSTASSFLEQAYRATDPGYDGRVSVPVLWDKEDRAIVSNESADIVRIFNEWAGGDLYPDEMRAEIDELNEWIYSEFQNGVYRAGFARSPGGLRRGLPRRVHRARAARDAPGERRYLAGDAITEADWRLLPTLLRFDAVYHTHFRCNGKRLIEYPNLLRYTTTSTASRTSPRRSRSTRSSATTTRPTTS